ncbi:conjugal transfer protein TraB [Streptomyces sp. NPDC004533]|uniref:conjugal transfer protein TraB n=1 Tax=Streptomyces sp. NPDC004533 TaxID=3154278 RepID=UPI0033B074B9
MSGELAPRNSNAAAPTDGDNRYKAVQHKLKTLASAMDQACGDLLRLQISMQANANRSEELARDIAHAELDPMFVEMQNAVSIALGGAAVEVRRLNEMANEVVGLTEQARATHSRFYQGLDEVRSSRPHKTPRPGFLVRKGG